MRTAHFGDFKRNPHIRKYLYIKRGGRNIGHFPCDGPLMPRLLESSLKQTECVVHYGISDYALLETAVVLETGSSSHDHYTLLETLLSFTIVPPILTIEHRLMCTRQSARSAAPHHNSREAFHPLLQYYHNRTNLHDRGSLHDLQHLLHLVV